MKKDWRSTKVQFALSCKTSDEHCNNVMNYIVDCGNVNPLWVSFPKVTHGIADVFVMFWRNLPQHVVQFGQASTIVWKGEAVSRRTPAASWWGAALREAKNSSFIVDPGARLSFTCRCLTVALEVRRNYFSFLLHFISVDENYQNVPHLLIHIPEKSH